MADFVDPYLDPDTGLLLNKVGARTQEQLDVIEAEFTAIRALQIIDRPPAVSGDLSQLKAIHRELFQDVYPWAGELRTVDIRKSVKGADPFLPVSMIARSAMFAAEELRADSMLRGLSQEKFVERLSHHYDQFNYIHPFREGNGRTQRLFWDQVANKAGKGIDWKAVHGAENDAASIAGGRGDLGPLLEMFQKIVSDKQSTDVSRRPLTMAERESQILDQAKRAGMLSGTGPLTDRDRKTLGQSSVKPLDREQLHEQRAERAKKARGSSRQDTTNYRAQGQERGD